MKSLRTRITVTMLCVMVATLTFVTVFTTFFIQRTESHKSDQLLLLLCETGEKNLNYYFNSVQKSVKKVASFTEADITGLSDEDLRAHMERVRKYFDEMAGKTNGVMTYYYRIDPEISETVKGFWYVNLDDEGFVEHEVTDITKYDLKDTSKLVWFTVPKYEGRPIWLPPYITDTIDMRVISYDVPVYFKGTFVGVVGIEVDYSTMAEQVDSIRLYNNGYAFLNDENGDLFYHPFIDVTDLTNETKPDLPSGVLDNSTFFNYSYKGENKRAAWLPLVNGMRLNVAVPVSETHGDWQKLILNTVILSLTALIAASLFLFFYSRRITRPLVQLTEAAEQVDKGNFDITLNYEKDDELGRLTRTFKQLSSHVKDHISDLNKQVFVDALTHVKNKGAFTNSIKDLQSEIDKEQDGTAFAILVFDCDNLKLINDRYGHEKGDVYLNTASRTISRIFKHSPVFRVGGDEFTVILKNDDYDNRDTLMNEFVKLQEIINTSAVNQWEQVHIAMGLAVYDPDMDSTASDVVRRADKSMYENKRDKKTS